MILRNNYYNCDIHTHACTLLVLHIYLNIYTRRVSFRLVSSRLVSSRLVSSRLVSLLLFHLISSRKVFSWIGFLRFYIRNTRAPATCRRGDPILSYARFVDGRFSKLSYRWAIFATRLASPRARLVSTNCVRSHLLSGRVFDRQQRLAFLFLYISWCATFRQRVSAETFRFYCSPFIVALRSYVLANRTIETVTLYFTYSVARSSLSRWYKHVQLKSFRFVKRV